MRTPTAVIIAAVVDTSGRPGHSLSVTLS